MNKNICVIIVNRTNYTKLKPILLELNKYDVNLNIVGSSSLILDKYANTYHDVEGDGFVIDSKINCLLSKDSHESMLITSGLSMIQHSKYLNDNRPDLLLVVGDRFDTFPPVLCSSIMNIPIAHIQGGELSGTIDNRIRNLISSLSSLHFVSTKNSKKRLISIGVDKDTIFNFGCPAVEYINSINIDKKFDPHMLHKEFKHNLDISENEDYFMVMVHPDTTNPNDVDMSTVFRAINYFGVKTIVFYPNVDAYNSLILRSISEFRDHNNFYLVKHIPIEGYIHLLAHSKCLIGNSSSGIREAASFGIPVINIGNRQINRERNDNTFDVICDYDLIIKAIQLSLKRKFSKNNIYYQKNCSKKIANKILEFLNY